MPVADRAATARRLLENQIHRAAVAELDGAAAW